MIFQQLTVHGHAHGDALFKAAQLALVACDLIDDAATFIFTRVSWMEVFLNGPAEETLKRVNRERRQEKLL